MVTSSVYSLRRYFMWPILMHKIEKKKFYCSMRVKTWLRIWLSICFQLVLLLSLCAVLKKCLLIPKKYVNSKSITKSCQIFKFDKKKEHHYFINQQQNGNNQTELVTSSLVRKLLRIQNLRFYGDFINL